MHLQNYCATRLLTDAAKTIFKLDNGLMRVQNYFQT